MRLPIRLSSFVIRRKEVPESLREAIAADKPCVLSHRAQQLVIDVVSNRQGRVTHRTPYFIQNLLSLRQE
ncbi:MAG: hypothetical protein ACE5LU_25925 [Anaerolineae bacterium]